MKNIFVVLVLIFLFSLNVYAESDTLEIKLNNGKIEKISVDQIKRIQFENLTAIIDNQLTDNRLLLKDNHPNPFFDYTSIEFELKEAGNVQLFIYDADGNIVQILQCAGCLPGVNNIIWDRRNNKSNKVPSGIYYYEVHFGSEVHLKKMVILN